MNKETLTQMLQSAQNRANNQAKLLADTKAQYEEAVRNSMIATAKKLHNQKARQEMALNATNEEIREIQGALSKDAENDLVGQANKNSRK